MSEAIRARLEERLTILVHTASRMETKLDNVMERVTAVEKEVLVFREAKLPAKVEGLERKSWWVTGVVAAVAALGAAAQWAARLWHSSDR